MVRFLFLILLLAFIPQAHAKDLEYTSFAQIPIQHEGRIKPLDTFAKTALYTFSGKSAGAEKWLAETLFDPATALQRPVFRILRPQAFNLAARKSKIYSFAEIAPVLQARGETILTLGGKDEKDWSEDQRELMRLHEVYILYTQLLRSFSFLLPLNIELPASLAKEWKITEEKPFTVSEYRRFAQKLDAHIQAITKKKGTDLEKYSEEERAIASFAMNMNILESAGQNNILFRIIPAFEGQEWYSPWALTQIGEGSPQAAAYLETWKALAFAYIQQDGAAWKQNADKALTQSQSFALTRKLKLEYVYNNFHPLTITMVLYALALAGFAAFVLRDCKNSKCLAILALAGGCALHSASIAARIYILDRPPVGTLYESILFVAFICALIGLIFEAIKRDGNGILIGALSGLLLLFTAQGFGGDDTMKMLVAVLNTNFWLTTHVLCITTGYGWCLITALLAHIWLIQTARSRDADNLVRPIKTLALLSLLFTAFGTLLGGIWADQSWGRFWGWDPKENGALLIVLWLIWALHGAISRHLKNVWFIASMAALSIIVAIAWFGVNLLSTGLHSYGFITGVAGALFAFCAVEIALIGGLVWKTKR